MMTQSDTSNFLYLVVRHKAEDPSYSNQWVKLPGSYLLQSIVTTQIVLDECKKELAAKRLIYVHRCGTSKTPPVIACCMEIESIDEEKMCVTFKGQQELILAPPRRANQGRLWYRDILPVPRRGN